MREEVQGGSPQLANVISLWRLATVTRFLAGSFSPLAAICRCRLRAPLLTYCLCGGLAAHIYTPGWHLTRKETQLVRKKGGLLWRRRDENCTCRDRAVGVCRSASLKGLNVSQPERDVLSGRVIYSTICIRCHGVDGKGDGQMKFTPPVADLTSTVVQGKLDARLF